MEDKDKKIPKEVWDKEEEKYNLGKIEEAQDNALIEAKKIINDSEGDNREGTVCVS